MITIPKPCLLYTSTLDSTYINQLHSELETDGRNIKESGYYDLVAMQLAHKHPEFDKANLIERLCIPDRVFQFRVTWMDDKGNIQTNMGYRVQHLSLIHI